MERTIDELVELFNQRLAPGEVVAWEDHGSIVIATVRMGAEAAADLMGLDERDQLTKQVDEALSEGTVIAHMMLAEDIKAVNAENDRLRDLIQTLCDFGDDCVRYSPKLGEAIKKARAELEGNNAT